MIAADRPKTVGSVREDHLALMREWRTIEDDAQRAERAKALRERVKTAGRDITAPGERDEAQGIVDYWASAISGLPAEPYPPILTLDAYVGDAAKQASISAREAFQALTSEEERRVARQLFEDLLYEGPNGIERGPPRTRAVLKQRIASDALDTVLDRFVETGAITRLAGEAVETERFEASDPHLCDDWPELRGWLEELHDYNEIRSGLIPQADRWLKSNKNPARLVRVSEIRNIDRFRGETDTLDDFIDASKGAQRRERQIIFLAAALALAVVAGFGFFTYQQSQAVGQAKEAAFEKVTAANTQRNQATERLDELEENISSGSDPAAIGSLAPARVEESVKAARLPYQSGTLWLGSVARPQVGRVGRGAGPTPLDRATIGATYRVLADIKLRDGLPNRDYAAGDEKAIIPAGTLIVITAPPQAYDRPTGRQYWANVRVVPRVYVQYANGDRTAIQPLRELLSDAGFDVPAAEQISSAAGQSEVRYFNTMDREASSYLVGELRRSSFSAARDVGCQSFANSRLNGRDFTIELWIDLAPKRTAPRRQQC